MKKLLKENGEFIQTGFSLIAIIISMIVGYRQCTQESEIQEINTKITALNFQPRLDLEKDPNVRNFSFNPPKVQPALLVGNKIFVDTSKAIIKFDSSNNKLALLLKDSSYINAFHKLQNPKKFSGDTMFVDANTLGLKLKISMTIKNVGKSMAKMLLFMQTDTMTGKPIIREKIRDQINGKSINILSLDPMNEYVNAQILTNETHTIEMEHKPQFINKNGQVNIHYYFLYENELGDIYDSYFWIIYDNFPFLFEPIYSVDKKGGLKVQYKIHDDPSKRFNISVRKRTFENFNKEESKKIHDWLETIDRN